MSNSYRDIPAHIGFQIKSLFPDLSESIGRGDLAQIEPGGGGPRPSHSHEGGHLFIVLEGEVDLYIEDVCHKMETLHTKVVPEFTMHHMINNSNTTATVLGIQLKSERDKGYEDESI